MLDKIFAFFKWAKGVYEGSEALKAIYTVFNIATLAVGVKGYLQARQMMAQGQDILANKTAAGGKIPVIYGTRRVGAQVIYMDTHNNDSRDLYVVYALALGECEEIIERTIELDGNLITDNARFKEGGYVGSDKISSGAGSLNTVSQNGATVINAGAGGFGTNPAGQYRYVLNCHHGAASQTADPMLVASMTNWTSNHRLDGIAYIAAHYQWERHGMWSGVPQLTVQVRGRKVYDPRDSGQTFGDTSTYEWSDNPSLCFLDFISNNEYGKGLTASQLNLTTFGTAATTADALQHNPYYNGVEKSFTWSGTSGSNFILVSASGSGGLHWWQNKVGELFTLEDSSGNIAINSKAITAVQRTHFYGQGVKLQIYFAGTLSATYAEQTGTALAKVRRFHCHGLVDTNKTVMENAKELLANMRGIFLYIDGKYELQIEDSGSSTFTITDDHIIADAGISVDYGNKDKKANKVIVEFFNANKKYELDTVTVLHDASPEYYSDDNDEILEIKAEFPYVSDPYIAYNMGKAILVRSRKQKTIQFLGTPEMYKLNVGDIVTLNYAGTFDTSQTCRVEALELQSDGLVAVSLIEYFDVYTWETPPQEPLEDLADLPSAYAVAAPTNITFTDTNSSSTGRPFLSWDEPTDFPDYQYRVNVVDSSDNQVINRIVDVTNCDLNFVPTGSYVANITSLNVLGSESSPARFPATGTFSIGDAPTDTADIQNDAITTPLILDDAVTDAKINSLSANKITAGTIDASQITVTNIDADNITTGSLSADNIQIDNVTLDTDGSGNLIIKSGGVDTTQIANNAITTVLINDDAITTAKIIDDAVTNALIATNAVNQDSIAANSVTATEIVANTITASEIAASTITSANIASNTITAGNIAANTITATEMNVSNLSSISADLGSITGGSINIGSGNFTVDTSGNVVANSVTTRGKYLSQNITATGQAGLFSELSDSVTGGSDPLRILCPSDDSDKDFFILMGNDPYSMAFSSGIPTSANHGLWFTGTGSIYMGGTNDSFSPLADNSNDLGRLNNRWDDVYATNGTIQTSDANNKSNIADSDLGLSFVSQLTPRKYTLTNGDSNRTHYGLIAQEVKTVLDNNNINTSDFAPYIKGEILDTNNQGTGEYKHGLRYTELISILIKAIQELEQRIQDLEN